MLKRELSTLNLRVSAGRSLPFGLIKGLSLRTGDPLCVLERECHCHPSPHTPAPSHVTRFAAWCGRNPQPPTLNYQTSTLNHQPSQAIHFACWNGNVKAVEKLLDLGAGTPLPASERRGNRFKGFRVFYLRVKALFWP